MDVERIQNEASALLGSSRGEDVGIVKGPGLSALSTSLNLIKMALGSGVLTLPYAFSQAGILGGIVTLIVSGLMNFWAVHMLVKCHDRTSAESKRATTYSYSAILHELYGNRGVAVIEVTLFFTVFGALVAYLIFVSSTMAAVTDEISRKAWVCICTPLLVGMVCLNDYSFLSWMSIGGLLALLAAFASVFAYGASEHSYDVTGATGIIAGGLANFFSLAAFSYAFPVCFFPFYDQMRKEGPDDFMKMFSVTVIIVGTLFALLGIGPMGFFLETGVQQVIIDNLPKHTAYATIVRIAISLVIFLSYPLAFLNVTQTVSHKARGLYEGKAPDFFDYGSRIAVSLSSGLVALVLPNMADVIAVVGAFAISLLSFVLPPFCYYRLCSHEMAPMERLSVVAFFFVSIVVMVYATYSAMKTLISHL